MVLSFRSAVPAFRALRRPTLPLQSLLASQTARRCLSEQTKAAIDQAIGSHPVVVFMKGTPEAPQCGFSRATIQVLGLQGVDPKKFAAYNVLEDPELREGIKEYSNWPTIPQVYVNVRQSA